MNCESPAATIACAISESVTPGVFEYMAYLVVPLFLGIVTLAVALASWRVGRSSYVLSQTIAEEQTRRELADRRLALADSAFQWSALRWTGDDPTAHEQARRASEIGRLSVALTESGLSGAADLQDFLWEINKAKDPKDLPEPWRALVLTYSGGYFAALTEKAIIRWLRKSESYTEFLEELRLGIPEMYKSARRSARSAIKKSRRAKSCTK